VANGHLEFGEWDDLDLDLGPRTLLEAAPDDGLTTAGFALRAMNHLASASLAHRRRDRR
jgi:hypothetical protein